VAEIAARPFRKRDAETAWDIGKSSNTNRGEKMRPPPNPTIVSTKDDIKIIAKRK